MPKVTLEQKETLAVLRLTNGVTKELLKAVRQVKEENLGLVLAGGTKFFSIGLDLPILLALNRDEMKEFWDNFIQAVFDLFTFPLPTACAIAGHAPAGGTVLALACDYRFAASGRKLFCIRAI
ncbi:MAG: enoyl-CoA hydratase/isomerase family protein [Deltaproteobacteria bacterium]|nr:enoyl-CoA hydratase/isomerase family protein [Deltaproteobacteria bacterium]